MSENATGSAPSTGGAKVLQGLRITVVADIAMILAVVTLIFWVGRQAERLDRLDKSNIEQRESVEQIKDQNTKISGQVLQMSSAASMAAVDQRLSIAETKITAQESFQRELKTDMVSRLSRIESKLDQVR
jgi:biopolymer transport protein ExbB/TolQ